MFDLETEPQLTVKKLHTLVRWFARGLEEVAPNEAVEKTAVAVLPVGTLAATFAAAAASVVEPVVVAAAFGVAGSVAAEVSAVVFSALVVVVVVVVGGDSRVPVATLAAAAAVSVTDFVERVLLVAKIVVKIVLRCFVVVESAGAADAVVPVTKLTAETVAVHLLGDGLLREWWVL